jgi:hypothetical protein
MKKNNPHTPILLREAAGTSPKVYARYGSSYLNVPYSKQPQALPGVSFKSGMARSRRRR